MMGRRAYVMAHDGWIGAKPLICNDMDSIISSRTACAGSSDVYTHGCAASLCILVAAATKVRQGMLYGFPQLSAIHQTSQNVFNL